jgi:hypothetical protein
MGAVRGGGLGWEPCGAVDWDGSRAGRWIGMGAVRGGGLLGWIGLPMLLIQ